MKATSNFTPRALAILGSLFCLASFPLAAQDSYLPLAEGNRWVLRSPATPQPITLEVLSPDDDGFRIRFASPFGESDWTLVPRGQQFLMTKYGKGGQMMDLPANQVYFDFAAPKGRSWNMKAGRMTVSQRDLRVQTKSKTYDNAIQIRQGKDLIFSFAEGVGFVQVGEGRNAFVLDEDASSISSGSAGRGSSNQENARNDNAPPPSASIEDDTRPVSHVPTALPPRSGARGEATRPTATRYTPAGPALFGITINTFASEPQVPENILKRWNQSLATGVNFVVSNGKWNELEPSRGQYKLDPIRFQVYEAQKHNLQVAYTLRLIDTVARTMPKDLERRRWSDPEIERRLMSLLEAIAPEFKDRVKWFMFGNEIDGYFGRNPKELEEFTALYDKVARKIKQLVPGIQVSSTIMFGGIESLNTSMAPLNDRFDFLAITYYPIRGDFTMKDPSIVKNDFGLMRKAAAGRSVVLQEIGYASDALNGSSPEKQAAFLRNVFAEVRANRDLIAAGSYFMLADFSDQFTRDLANFYGIKGYKIFDSFLQTNGLFDKQGRAKPAWRVFETEMKKLSQQ
ncbi:MAG: hypothetical protein NW208_05615 [Bryobacter sp.]|nr:hypothetical protein [Bryobacter sp.]